MFNKMNFITHMMICLGVFAIVVIAKAGDLAIKKDYPLEQLSKNVYVIHGPNEEVSKENQGFRNNPVLVTTAKGIVVIDPGSSLYTGEMVVKKARGLSNKPIIAVFNTHAHGDHWLGNHGIKKHFPEVSIYAHENTRVAIESGEGDMWVKSINKMSGGQIEGTKVVAPDKVVKNGEQIVMGGTTFRIYHNGKAHSHNDLMIEIVEEKVFVFGDNLRRKNFSLFMASFTGNLAALDIGQKVNARVYIPGHGISGDKSIISEYREFIVDIKREVKKHFEAGLSDFEMKPKVIKSLSKYKSWSGFEGNIGRLINLAYLEVENESF